MIRARVTDRPTTGSAVDVIEPMRGRVLLALAILAWLACFAILQRFGTWHQFAGAGVILAALSLVLRVVPAGLLRPSWREVGLGAVAGLLMVVVTHAAYATTASLLPTWHEETTRLFAFLRVGSFSSGARAALIVVIATCEEILFRGPLAGSDAARDSDHPRIVDGAGYRRLAAYAGAYAVATATLGSPLLLLCAFLCGVAWGVLRVQAASLVVPIVAHVIWDLGVLVLWPLTGT